MSSNNDVEMLDEDSTTKTTTTTTTTTTNNGSMFFDEDEDGDYVEHEIPVYLSQGLANNLYLFQYPLRQPWRPYDMTKLEELRIKPKQQKVEIDLSIDPETENYNSDSMVKTTKYTLSSTTVSHRTNYAIGLMKNGELHLTPLQSIIQLRPQFKFFDDKWQEEKLRKKQDSKEEDEENEEEPEKPPPIQFKKPGAKMAAQQPNLIKQMEDSEQWIKVDLVDDEFNQDLINHFEKLQCDDTINSIDYDLNEGQYFDLLCPVQNDDQVWQPKKSYIQETESLESIHKLKLAGQIKGIMTNGHVVPFSKIVQLLSPNVKRGVMEVDIIEELEKVAVLVRGRWVVKSFFVAKDQDLEYGRDYLLLEFYDHEDGIDKKEFCDKTKISFEDGRELLSKIADLNNVTRRWYLKKQPDEDFLYRNARILENSERYFEDHREEILNRVKEMASPNRNSIFGFTKIPANYREGKTVEHQLLFLLYNIFKKSGVASIEFIKQSIAHQREAKSDNNLLGQVNDKMVDDQLKKMATIVRYNYVLKSVGNIKIDKYRDIILEAFNKKVGLQRDDIIEFLKEKMENNYVDIPANTFSSIMNELATINGKTWIFKGGKN
ncbi:hypothetical protein DICPUDRAFT_148777 [Dictyostelium purpureum]|uniref:RNA polymerase III subunit n=1 Tax=Dictyostelium purpureum TaxID=5786 RepID=F0ZBZ4_DICPU|nr:uncharacterized protein DICPUDRAFT_148777 [Dictyostelium purpureum]EGC38572.1 hypothetical protein DICPUDRAFT_148777 [Dictyostelium purpureum]|eukprot:XP_003284943.1 hypothetical protein DICPUDRAFT_148777 [Dictyostelium purpureum]